MNLWESTKKNSLRKHSKWLTVWTVVTSVHEWRRCVWIRKKFLQTIHLHGDEAGRSPPEAFPLSSEYKLEWTHCYVNYLLLISSLTGDWRPLLMRQGRSTRPDDAPGKMSEVDRGTIHSVGPDIYVLPNQYPAFVVARRLVAKSLFQFCFLWPCLKWWRKEKQL